jgi:hypothetical protein|tara:strand:- start:431 stop:550 length:120 start_codon:yes stop_codon:yes gene_type:complete
MKIKKLKNTPFKPKGVKGLVSKKYTATKRLANKIKKLTT